MAIMGTFSSFTGARLAIYASQASLNVTGNNIANVNTKGYTRQRMDLVSLHSTGWPEYRNSYQVDIGYGVLCDQVSQLRDPFLDIRYRDENAELGFYDAKQNAISQLSSILDEVAKGDDYFGVVEKQLGDVFTTLENLKQRVGTDEYDDQFRAACYTLTGLLNDAAKRLETVRDNKADELKQDTKQVNLLLQEIRDLNDEIRTQGICGDSALELRDARNVAIDKLSKYMKIDVKYSNEYIDQYTTVEKLSISLADTQPEIKLIDGIYGTQFMMNETVPKPNPEYNPSLTTSMKYIGIDGKPTDIEREAAYMSSGDPDRPYCQAAYGKETNYQKALPMMNSDPNTKEAKPYLTWDGKTNQYVPTSELRDAAPVVFPGSGQQAFLDANGKICGAADAALLMNPDAETNAEMPYLMQETNEDGTVSFVPTADETMAAKLTAPVKVENDGSLTLIAPGVLPPAVWPDGTTPEYISGTMNGYAPTDKIEDALKQLNDTGDGKYDPTLSTSNKYLKKGAVIENGKVIDPEKYATDDPDDPDIDMVPSFSTEEADADKNTYLYQLEPLRDKEGRLIRNKYDQEVDDIVDLGDRTLVSGSLQAIREFLTEEGEFSSDYDIAADKDANTKRGVRYYQHVLDSWAQKFADTFNEANQMDPTAIYQMKNGMFVDTDGAEIKFGENNDQTIEIQKNIAVKDAGKYTQAELDALKANGIINMGNEPFRVNDQDQYIDSEGQAILFNGKPFTLKDHDNAPGSDQKAMVQILRENGVLKDNIEPDKAFKTEETVINKTSVKIFSKANDPGQPVQVDKEPSDYTDEELAALRKSGVLTDEYGFYNGGVLFSNRSDGNDPTGITAKNISIAHAWDNGEVRVLNTKKPDYVDPITGEIQTSTTANDNILHMIDLFNRKMTYEAVDTVEDAAAERFFFKGSFQEMYTAISGTLAADGMVTYARYKNYDLSTLDLDNQRTSVSGVDLNEEATNMMQFSKSYSAACRLLTTLDSMLDKLINGTAI